MAGNVFAALILEGKLRTEGELKSCYRSLAARVHPDALGQGASEEAFLKLRRDYEAARGLLAARAAGAQAQGQGLGAAGARRPTRGEVYLLFEELAATGLPLAPSVRASSRAYRARVRRFSELLEAYGALPGWSFGEVERELYEIRGECIVDNPLYGKLRLILYNLVSWHWEPRAFTRAALRKWMAEIRPELEARGLRAALAFLSWLVEDLEGGPAL